MHNKNFFKKLYHLNTSFVLMLICHTFDGHSMAIDQKDNEICGLAENQIQESLSHPNKYLMRGIAINPRCLESENVNSECLTEQNKLIECLQKQYMLAKGKLYLTILITLNILYNDNYLEKYIN